MDNFEDPRIAAAFVSGVVALVISAIGFLAQRHFYNRDFDRNKDDLRTQYQAEQVAFELLNVQTERLRSFKAIRRRLGGFDDDEIRRILVRAGAVRFYGRNSHKELWGLLSHHRYALGPEGADAQGQVSDTPLTEVEMDRFSDDELGYEGEEGPEDAEEEEEFASGRPY